MLIQYIIKKCKFSQTFFIEEGRNFYSLFIKAMGQVAQAARRLIAGWRPNFDPGCRRSEDFSSLLRVQTVPGVQAYSVSYKMSTEGSPQGVKTTEHILATLLLASAEALYSTCAPLVPYPPVRHYGLKRGYFYLFIYESFRCELTYRFLFTATINRYILCYNEKFCHQK